MDRRAFIKLSAITGSAATLAGCGHPEDQLIRFIPDEELVPGVAAWKPSICPGCTAGCGLQVRVMEADVEVTRNGQRGVTKMGVAKKLEGNPNHPVSQGALCPRGQAAIQITYHPDRITHPLKRTGARGAGQFQDVTWDEALSELLSRLDALAAARTQASLAFLTRRRNSARQDLTALFLERFGAPPPLTFELFGDDVLRRANALSFGRDQLPTFDLARSRYLLAFGADFLGTWNSPVSQNAGYGSMRRGPSGSRGKFVQVEPRMSQTGANADEWVPVRPGTEGVLALGLAHVILNDRLKPAGAAGQAGAVIEGWSAGLSDYTPEQVEKQTGVPAAKITRLAHEFAARQPSVALIGGAPLAQTNGLFQAVAVNALNALAGSVDAPGGLFFTPQTTVRPAARGALDTVTADILAAPQSPIQALLIDDANPVFASPRAWRVREAFEKIPFIASFGSFIDETSILADLILPDHSFLESWVDARPESGAMVAVAGVAAPAMRPLHGTRAMPDVLLDVGRRLQRPLDPPLAWETFDAMLGETFAALPGSPAGDGWSTAQQQGGWWGELPQPALPPLQAPPLRFAEPQFDGAVGEYPFHFLPYASQAFLDGSLAHLPWMQELPDPLTSAMWCSWVEINPTTAARLKIAPGDMVEIRSSHGSVQAPAVVSPGLAPDVIAMPVGQGHDTFTRYASGRGANPIGILAPLTEPETGSLAWAATRVQVARVGEDDGQLILFAGQMREEPFGHHR
ncbi:MAG: molybdopterin-dependent oxidoreductase [Acidobacteria bacterium]|nr:molybdopterin-dependent oxidoreductase [Acidobacteriota bacterium]